MTTQQPCGAPVPDLPREPDVDPWIVTTPLGQLPGEPARPRRPTPARLRTYFLRQFARSGSLVEAAARTGTTPRTVQRWRATDPHFARRFDAVVEQRAEMLEDAAVHRAFSVDRRTVWHRSRPVAIVERYNDAMLMRMLVRFDRIRERMPKETTQHSAGLVTDLDLAKGMVSLLSPSERQEFEAFMGR